MPARFFEQEDRSRDDMRLSKRVALVVGNGDYPHARLANARNDARLVASALEAIGFSAEVLLDAGKTALETAIVRLGERMERAGAAALGFFYFAGHGIQHEGVNFILPVDADLPDARYLRSGAVPVDLVIEEIDRGGQAEAAVVALDACRDNRIPNRSGGPLRGLASMQRVPPGTIVAFATAADQVADDGTAGNSPFAISLSKRLVEPGRRLDEIFFMVARDVAATTGGAQQPSLFVQGAVAPIVLHGDAAAAAEVEDKIGRTDAVRRDAPRKRSARDGTTVQRLAAIELDAETRRTGRKLFQQRWVQAIAVGAALVLLLGIGGVIAWRMWPTLTHSLSVSVVNDGRTRITQLFVHPEGRVSSDDLLGKGTLPPGVGMRFQLKRDTGCRFDVEARYPDNRKETRSGVDLCRNPEVVFKGS